MDATGAPRPLDTDHLSQDGSTADPAYAPVIRVGETMRQRFDRISTAMKQLIVDNEAPLSQPDLTDMLASSVEGNLETIIQLLCNRIPVQDAHPSTVAIRYAHLLADRGIPADQLRRAYHHGAEGMRREIFAIVRGLDCTPDEKLQVLHYIDGFSHSYVDWICTEVLTAYEQEARRLTDYSATATATVIRQILAGSAVPAPQFEKTTGYRLDQCHRAAVVWVDQDGAAVDHTEELLRAVQRISLHPGFTGPTLFTAVDRATAWVWFGVRHREPVPDTTALTAGPGTGGARVRICFGAAGSGTAGFRSSHRQALAAERVALIAGPEHRTPVRYDDPGVALASLLSTDMPALRTWVNEQLGGLTARTGNAARLRETYSVFLDTDASYTRTGEKMNLHRNTVKYRIEQARSLTGEGAQRSPAEISVALHMCLLLGPAVLAADPQET